jgi:hypothetical protein
MSGIQTCNFPPTNPEKKGIVALVMYKPQLSRGAGYFRLVMKHTNSYPVLIAENSWYNRNTVRLSRDS